MYAQDMLSKARALLDSAESFEAMGNPEVAASYRAKAEHLVQKFRLDEEALIAKDQTALTPILVKVTLLTKSSPFQRAYVDLFYYIAQHTGVRVHYSWDHVQGEGYHLVAHTVGYESDVRYAEMLFTSARLVFSERLEPKVNPSLTDQVNAYRLRASGMERVRVSEALWGNRDKANLSKVGRYYKAECKVRGEEPALDGRGVTGKVYREQYASEFPYALSARLRRAQDAAGQFGGGLTLHGRKDRVDEAFYTHFENLRPAPKVEGEVALVQPECPACKTTKSESGKCRDHRPRSTTAKDIARWKAYNSPAAQRGRDAGTVAASHVELNRSGKAGIEG